MKDIISSLAEMLTSVFSYINTENSKKYNVKVAEIILAIQQEEAKGYYCDDTKLKTLYKQLPVYKDLALTELKQLQQGK